MQQEAAGIRVNEAVRNYILDIGEATRTHPSVILGASTRGLIALKHMSQALAAVRGQEYVTPDNVQTAVRFVLPHRLICRGRKSGDITDEIVSGVKVPTE